MRVRLSSLKVQLGGLVLLVAHQSHGVQGRITRTLEIEA